MPVKELSAYGNLPAGWKPVPPAGYTPINPSTEPALVKPKENMVSILGRAALSMFPGSQGPGGPSLADETKAEIQQAGQSTEQFLGNVIQPMLDMTGKALAIDTAK